MIENAITFFHQGGGKSATIFVTHGSKYIKRLLQQSTEFDCLEIGLHPCMTKLGKKTLQDFKNDMEDFYGSSIVISRFHRLEYSYRNLYELGNCGIKYDNSYLTYLQPHLFKNRINNNISQIPYHFEDGTFENLGTEREVFYKFIQQQELLNVTFHPLNVYFNTSSFDQRAKIFAHINNELSSLRVDKAEKLIEKNTLGSRDLFIQLLRQISQTNCQQLTCQEYADEVCNNWKSENHIPLD